MTRQLFIPALGTELTLAEPWEFALYNEYRNQTLMTLLGDSRSAEYGKDLTAERVTLPAGAVLRIDRIYVRKGQDGFDSISFMLVGAKAAVGSWWQRKQADDGQAVRFPRRPVRFWAKLDDANKIVFADGTHEEAHA